MFKRSWIILLSLLLTAFSAAALETPNSRQARKIFDQAYQQVFGSQGATLHYAVNIIGIYKTEGTIWYKGTKSCFVESRYSAWSDGHTYYRADSKKKTVEIHNANSDKRDQYMSKFKFDPDDFTYHIASVDEGLEITLHAKPGVKGIKHVKAILDRHTRAPKSLKIKLAFFWTTVRITHFRSGLTDDSVFIFPRSRFVGYRIIDKRPD
ncbi:MAG: hypothetical protein MR450_05860 [Prevotella sp.]|nr:hypothetical protein [Prevotella sp.]MDY4040032.1 hypothetical protein [Prevotella sp.]